MAGKIMALESPEILYGVTNCSGKNYESIVHISADIVPEEVIKAIAAENLTILSNILNRIENPVCLPYPKDKKIIRDVIDKLIQVENSAKIKPEFITKAWLALDSLVPKKSENGKRSIAGEELSDFEEKLITSRVTALEVDIYDPKPGNWGSIPLEVRKIIFSVARVYVELTDTCTAMCGFCRLAKKGPPTSKISFSSLLRLFQEMNEYRYCASSEGYCDMLFYATDPFDIRYITPEGDDLDYNDVAGKYEQIYEKDDKRLFTSTAIPIGEELRVLQFAMDLIEAEPNSVKDRINTIFRISRGKRNNIRAENIRIILNVLYNLNPRLRQKIAITNPRESEARRVGNSVEGQKEKMSFFDILGITCTDDVIVNPSGVHNTVMTATTNETQVGELRIPVISDLGHTITYTFVHHSGRNDGGKEVAPLNKYPRVIYNQVVQVHDGQDKIVMSTEENEFRSPFRALARIVSILSRYTPVGADLKQNLKIPLHQFNEQLYTLYIRKCIKSKIDYQDVELVQAHVSELHSQQKENYVMEQCLRILRVLEII